MLSILPSQHVRTRYTLPIRNWDFAQKLHFCASSPREFLLYLTYKELRLVGSGYRSIVGHLCGACYTLPIRNWDWLTWVWFLLYLTYKELRHKRISPVDVWVLLSPLYLTYKELRHIAVNGTAYFWHDAEVMLYLTYKELVVCLCLSPRAPKKRANSCLLGSMRICSPFVL